MEKTQNKKGVLITIYGVNNVGKTTQSKILVRKLKKLGHKAKYVKYPIYDIIPTGPFLNKTMRDPKGQKISEDELQLWFVLNRYQFEPTLKKLLDEGYVVIAEDYSGTGIAWGMAKGLQEEWLVSANKYLLKEDFSIILKGQRNAIAKEKDHVHEQNDVLVKKSEAAHFYLAKKFGWKIIEIEPMVMTTAKKIFKAVDDFLSHR